MSCARKGRDVEATAVRWLKAHGYTTHRVVRNAKKRDGRWYSAGNDIFGCIDILAKRAGERTKFIQVTSSKHIGKKKRDLATVPWTNRHDSVEIWRWDAQQRCFQVYFLEEEYVLDESNRIFIHA